MSEENRRDSYWLGPAASAIGIPDRTVGDTNGGCVSWNLSCSATLASGTAMD